MTQVRRKVCMGVLLLCLASFQLLLGLSTAPPVRDFFARAPQRCTSSDWLIRRGQSNHQERVLTVRMDEGCDVFLPTSSRGAEGLAVQPSACVRTGIYSLEFIGSTLGTVMAAIVPAMMLSKATRTEFGDWKLGVAAFPTYGVSSALLSSAGTFAVGRLFGQRGSFVHALAGGAVGGLLGSAALFSGLSSGGREVMIPVGLLLPPMCSLIANNVWRKNETR